MKKRNLLLIVTFNFCSFFLTINYFFLTYLQLKTNDFFFCFFNLFDFFYNYIFVFVDVEKRVFLVFDC